VASPIVPAPSRSSASTWSYWSGEVTTATRSWFFAAARTIAGPPMSISSTTSATLRPRFAAVSSNG
jgi:hypothetical protein